MTVELTVETQADRSTRPFEFPLNPEVVFGRGPESPVALDGTALSREHFSLRREDGQVRVYDLSSNGTWHNGQRLGKGAWAVVGMGSVIEIMGYRFQIGAIKGEAKAEKPAPPGRQASQGETMAVKPPARPLLAPVSEFWAGFTGLEKTMLFVAACTAALLAAYLQAN